MDEQKLKSSKQIYDSFRNELENKIKDNYISINNPKCYLINDSWINEYINTINKTNVGNKENNSISKYRKRLSLSFAKPDFLNDLTSIINYLKEEK